ncbi:MAG: REP-associated tyrosine transposase [Peptococcaceae bacterium]
MPRAARKKSATGIYHIMMRGINRQNIFHDDLDREKLLQTINHYKAISNYEIYSYCLMDNHIHLLIREMEEPLATIIKRISGSYVYWYNMKYDRCGHLFQERFKSEVIEDDEYFLTVLRYIHQNPVKAGIVRKAGDYKWSSYSEYTEGAGIVAIDFALELLSSKGEKAIKEYVEFMNKANKDKCLEYKERKITGDDEIRSYFARLGIVDINKLKQLEKSKRDEVLRMVKAKEGVTIRQLARVTGIAKSVIARV